MAAVVPPIVPEIQALAAAHPGTVSLAQGMVWFTPPAELVHAALSASEPDDARYGSVFGDPDLLETYARRLAALHGYDAEDLDGRLAATAGANMAFLQAVLAITSPGDRVVLREPYYFNHEMAVRIAGLDPVVVPGTGSEDDQVAALSGAIDDRTRAVVTVSPNNPTGDVMSASLVGRINGLARDAGLFHISDEAYDELVFDGAAHHAPAAVPGAKDHTIALYSLSKSFGFAGWRLGFAVLPRALAADFRKVQDTNLICPTRVTQRLATRLLQDWDAPRRTLIAGLGAQRRRLADALASMGVAVTAAAGGGALYLWVPVPGAHDGDRVCRELVTRFGVATLPGSAFARPGTFGNHIRISFGGVTGAAFDEALGRLVDGLAQLTGRTG